MSTPPNKNADQDVVADFGAEWSRFDQNDVPTAELARQFADYFAVFPWDQVGEHSRGFDLGCGSGRWADFVAPRVAELNCIEPSGEALAVAKRKLAIHPNCRFYQNSADEKPLGNATMDFGYSLGVLHHIPDSIAALKCCAEQLKPGGVFLAYLYYALDGRPWWYKALWRLSDEMRRVISRRPQAIKHAIADAIALCIYWPLAKLAWLIGELGAPTRQLPLASYAGKSFSTLRTDALDRFGTRLEKRFTRDEIKSMFEIAGFENIIFSDRQPYWCVVATRAARNC